MKNSNVQKLTDKMSRHTVRIMSASPHAGIVSENRRDDFLVINVNELVNGVPTGCATLVFQGDLPTTVELRDNDLKIEGTWGWHAKFGSRFDVDAWAPVERTAIKPAAEPVARKTRRLEALPEAPPKAPVKPAKAAKRSQRRSAPARKATPTAEAIAQTNNWYSESGGKGDTLDFLDNS